MPGGRMHPALRVVYLSLLLVGAFAGEPQKILMIGNSLTYTWDIPTILERFAAETKRELKITRHFTGGKDLSWHWDNPSENLTAPQRIAQGGFDLVILQDSSQRSKKADERTDFARITGEYHKAISAGGMQTMFYMGFLREPDITQAKIQPLVDMYTTQADALGIACAPVALAFLRCQERLPALALLDNQADRKYAQNKTGTHQSPFGSYLAACTLWSAVFKQSPVGLRFRAAFDAKRELPIDEADAKAAQEIAWAVWQEYAAKRPAAKAGAKPKR